ncbi:hypothetical protein IV203_032457 [Nitzschia inconspicua]|uniref:Uncharacterized protein n=1 Tax=Nitzschia inconspicua TaxID=303405 RepID=A0A9K3KKE3_9STRA|nr:hypothetical protein IV203_032457 [Nitzschia inconspicua]
MAIAKYSKSHPSRHHQNSALARKPLVVRKGDKSKATLKNQSTITTVPTALKIHEIKAQLKSSADKAFIQLQFESCTVFIDNIATYQHEIKDIRNEVMCSIRQAATLSKSHIGIVQCDIFMGQAKEVHGYEQSSVYRACVQLKDPTMVRKFLTQRFPPVLNGIAMGVRSWTEYQQSAHSALDNAPTTIVTARAIDLKDIPSGVTMTQLSSFIVSLLRMIGRDQHTLVHCRTMGWNNRAYVELSDRKAVDQLLKIVKQLKSSCCKDNAYHSLLESTSFSLWTSKKIVVPFFFENGILIKLSQPSTVFSGNSNSKKAINDGFACDNDNDSTQYMIGQPCNPPMLGEKIIDDETLSCPSLKDEAEVERKAESCIVEYPELAVQVENKLSPGSILPMKNPENMTMCELLQAFQSMQNQILRLQTEVATLKNEKEELQEDMESRCSIMADDQVLIYKELVQERYLRGEAQEELKELRKYTIHTSVDADTPTETIVKKEKAKKTETFQTYFSAPFQPLFETGEHIESALENKAEEQDKLRRSERHRKCPRRHDEYCYDRF